jgi:hypothetical protein
MVVPDRAHVAARLAGAIVDLQRRPQRRGRDRSLVEAPWPAACGPCPTPPACAAASRTRPSRRAAAVSEYRRRRSDLDTCVRQLEALDPQATLNRGYAVVHKNGRVVSASPRSRRGRPSSKSRTVASRARRRPGTRRRRPAPPPSARTAKAGAEGALPGRGRAEALLFRLSNPSH